MSKRGMAGWLALSIGLSACGAASAVPSSAPSAGAPSGGSPRSVQAAPAASASGVAEKPSGAATSAPAPAASVAPSGAQASIKVGLIEPLTGPFADLAKDNIDGFNLYLSSVGGTVAGRKIEVVTADDRGQTDVGLTKAKQLVESDKVQVLGGITVTTVCYAVAAYVKEVQVPLIVSGNCGAQNLMVDPKYKSPYVVRLTQNATQLADPPADWAYSQGLRKAILIGVDLGGTLENTDSFASTFVKRGGSIVQEIHPAYGTADFGPFLAQLDKTADLLTIFLPGTDGLHFLDQYASYAGQRKLQIIDGYGTNTAGPTLSQLNGKAAGVVGEFVYSEGIDMPENASFLKAFHEKYPGRVVSGDVVQGYVGAQVLAAALTKVNGRIEDKDGFLKALYTTDLRTPKGPVKLDQDHDVIENAYLWRIDMKGNAPVHTLLKTYPDVSRGWGRTPEELARFPYGKLKDKWVGMTKDRLDQIVAQG